MAAAKSGTMPFVVSFGAEDYFLDKDIDRALGWKDRVVTLLDGDGMPDHELVSFCEMPTPEGEGRVVIVDYANKLKGDKTLRTYVEEKVPTDTSTVLVAIIRSEKLSDVWVKAGSKGRVIEHKKLKTWDNNNEVIKWVETEAKALGRRFDTGVSSLLYQLVGADLHKLHSELRKLCLIVPQGSSIGVTQVKLVVAPSPTSDPFQVADAVLEKDARKAMNALSILYKNQGDEVNVPLTAAIMKAVERALVARKILDRGGSEEDVATRLSMHPWRCKTQFMPFVKKHSARDLTRHMGRLCKLDADVKGPARSKRTLIELTVLSICAG
jgi:DNA polymerase III delta subunit